MKITNPFKSQYVRGIYPPYRVSIHDFHEEVKGTDFVNNPDIIPKLNDIKSHASLTEPIQYNGKGYTRDELQEILILSQDSYNEPE